MTERQCRLTRALLAGKEESEVSEKVFDSLSRLLNNSMYATIIHPGGRAIVLLEGEVFKAIHDAARAGAEIAAGGGQ